MPRALAQLVVVQILEHLPRALKVLVAPRGRKPPLTVCSHSRQQPRRHCRLTSAAFSVTVLQFRTALRRLRILAETQGTRPSLCGRRRGSTPQSSKDNAVCVPDKHRPRLVGPKELTSCTTSFYSASPSPSPLAPYQ